MISQTRSSPSDLEMNYVTQIRIRLIRRGSNPRFDGSSILSNFFFRSIIDSLESLAHHLERVDCDCCRSRNSTNYPGSSPLSTSHVPPCFFTMPRTVLASAGLEDLVVYVAISLHGFVLLIVPGSALRGEVPNTSTIPLGWDGSVNYLVVAESGLWAKGDTKRVVQKLPNFLFTRMVSCGNWFSASQAPQQPPKLPIDIPERSWSSIGRPWQSVKVGEHSLIHC